MVVGVWRMKQDWRKEEESTPVGEEREWVLRIGRERDGGAR